MCTELIYMYQDYAECIIKFEIIKRRRVLSGSETVHTSNKMMESSGVAVVGGVELQIELIRFI